MLETHITSATPSTEQPKLLHQPKGEWELLPWPSSPADGRPPHACSTASLMVSH